MKRDFTKKQKDIIKEIKKILPSWQCEYIKDQDNPHYDYCWVQGIESISYELNNKGMPVEFYWAGWDFHRFPSKGEFNITEGLNNELKTLKRFLKEARDNKKNKSKGVA